MLAVFDKVWHAGLLHKLKVYGVRGSILSIIESFLQKIMLLRLFLMVSPLHHMTSMQEYSRDRFWDPLCFWCISMTFLMVPFPELEFMQMILLHIPAYKHLTSLIRLRWQQSWRRTYVVMLSGWKVAGIIQCYTRTNCCLLIDTVRASWSFDNEWYQVNWVC